MNQNEQNKINSLSKIMGKDVSRETFSKLESFSEMLLKWNQKINLVSKKINSEELWTRHILDSAQLIKFIPTKAKHIVDLGSGAGFPGIILAIIGGYKVSLIESDKRKCAFMMEVASKFNLDITVICKRIEDVPQIECDIITSRALACLSKLISYSQLFINKDNFMLFLKGQNVVEELREASMDWKFEYNFYNSNLDGDGGVLKIFNLARL